MYSEIFTSHISHWRNTINQESGKINTIGVDPQVTPFLVKFYQEFSQWVLKQIYAVLQRGT